MRQCLVFRVFLSVLTVPAGLAGPSLADTTDTPSRWIGEAVEPGGRFSWSGSGPVFLFEGTTLSVTLEDDGNNSLMVELDGEAKRLDLLPGQQTYDVATELTPGPHNIRLVRRTERPIGPTRMVSAETDGRFLPTETPERRILVVGDSISAGYGIEGANQKCGFTPRTQNQYLTHAAVAARRLGAEVLTMAISGIGVARNYNGSTHRTMPNLIVRSEADVILVHLGTNDFTGGHRPADFSDRYAELLRRLREWNPGALIYTAIGPMLGTEDRAAASEAIAQAVGQREAEGDTAIRTIDFRVPAGEVGCNWHPNVLAHEYMADTLTEAIADDLGWNQ
ncbi:SGNH/GDSL hydrolase family protein [Pseudoruegeria sp. HB172150]|uniref:SGNH/GDSL hydrolase family protein n=1 Tax=Pseudoruegeria sp. HB172150 TaxID=2721164 RepID=UPI00155438CB|nr:SGNH/GDSL hydrolase family protein [Pseudoruegeria sp. HB172150]